jgi:hypothetical protein
MQTDNSTNFRFPPRRHILLDDAGENLPARPQRGNEEASISLLAPIMAFAIGFAVGGASFTPLISEDYLRGHAEGYQAGHTERAESVYESNARVREAMFSGVKMGYSAAQRGEPMPLTE